MVISKEFHFEASHILPLHPGKCSRLHGHSWKLIVGVKGKVNEITGFVCDYADLSALVKREVIDRLDHTHLGQGLVAIFGSDGIMKVHNGPPPFGREFYPSSENLARAIGKMLIPLVRELPFGGVELDHVTIDETCTSKCTWRPEDESR